jgi:NAD(P)-dependent dehydrogenase (short-subunit alcohol dehydrogenase family)
MKIKYSVVVITGANRGLGAQFATQMLERGAARVSRRARSRPH